MEFSPSRKLAAPEQPEQALDLANLCCPLLHLWVPKTHATWAYAPRRP